MKVIKIFGTIGATFMAAAFISGCNSSVTADGITKYGDRAVRGYCGDVPNDALCSDKNYTARYMEKWGDSETIDGNWAVNPFVIALMKIESNAIKLDFGNYVDPHYLSYSPQVWNRNYPGRSEPVPVPWRKFTWGNAAETKLDAINEISNSEAFSDFAKDFVEGLNFAKSHIGSRECSLWLGDRIVRSGAAKRSDLSLVEGFLSHGEASLTHWWIEINRDKKNVVYDCLFGRVGLRKKFRANGFEYRGLNVWHYDGRPTSYLLPPPERVSPQPRQKK